jgi:hypothetical protein
LSAKFVIEDCKKFLRYRIVWADNAYYAGEFNAFATPNHDPKIAPTLLVSKPINQTGERRFNNGQDWLALSIIVKTIDIGAKRWVAIVEQPPKQ